MKTVIVMKKTVKQKKNKNKEMKIFIFIMNDLTAKDSHRLQEALITQAFK
jgi:hypothetical protein